MADDRISLIMGQVLPVILFQGREQISDFTMEPEVNLFEQPQAEACYPSLVGDE